MSLLTPQEELDKQVQDRLDNLTVKQRISLAIDVTIEDFKTAFRWKKKTDKSEKYDFSSVTLQSRQNIFERLGGRISEDEHEEIRRRAFPKK